MLTAFGLTQQEAKLYIALHGHGGATGYEAARLAGISRSNAYAGLSSLADKGAARLVDGKPQRFVAVPAAEFCAGRIRRLDGYRARLEQELVLVDDEESPYLTIRGSANIADKVAAIIAATASRIYLAMPAHAAREFVAQLEEAAGRGVSVTLVTDAQLDVASAVVHRAPQLASSVRVIGDSAMTLTGELTGSDECTALYSVKKNLVNLIRDSIRNEIRLIELSRERTEDL